ncbi:hypothetical protein RHAL1_03932 [Beijerinckiaceae bacterium RH AL1]|nr:hypothetical protein [Beijerinckiaceae bacterium]VVB49622.1 hypothetical protein RHCH11_RHCH11_03856 [Beijerinckiaceae bacterium RH CH11]VVB49700.1 hypothetical protein RHAL8_03852 [Beijerinckiaceae bacterium RH AL8]VVC56996.1 hypothetical protein RHAL1_03932 [Beijerinckiaceae bacterium RH AL1]
MSLSSELFARPADLSPASRFTTMNGMVYLVSGLAFLAWPNLIQIVFRDAPFEGHEAALFRLLGMLLAIVGWLYIFGGLAGTRQFVWATIVDRVTIVPAVLVVMAINGIFPHLSIFFAVVDPAMAIGAYLLLHRRAPMPSRSPFGVRAPN